MTEKPVPDRIPGTDEKADVANRAERGVDELLRLIQDAAVEGPIDFESVIAALGLQQGELELLQRIIDGPRPPEDAPAPIPLKPE